jgi:hypothetical protein
LGDKESKENNTRKNEKGKQKDENQERTAHARMQTETARRMDIFRFCWGILQ